MAFVDKDLGTVEVGKLADLTIVRGDPLADLKAAANVEYVVKNGNDILAGADPGAVQDAARDGGAQGDQGLHAAMRP